MKKLGRIAAAFMASVFFVTGIPAMTAFAADEIPAAEETVTETPAVETVTEQPTVPETPAPVVTEPVVTEPVATEPTIEGNTEVVAPTEPEVTDGKEDTKTTEDAGVSGETVLNDVKVANAPLLADAEPAADDAEPTVKAIEPETPFDNSTTVADGTYLYENPNVDFIFTGGTKKASFDLVEVVVSGGKATATLTTTSKSMTHVYIGDKAVAGTTGEEVYNPETGEQSNNLYAISNKTVTIPVRINETVDFVGRTTGMSAPKWVQYHYKIVVSDQPVPLADYSKVEAARAKVPSDRRIYTDESVATLQNALDAVVEGRKASKQAEVDEWAATIEAAINGLTIDDNKEIETELSVNNISEMFNVVSAKLVTKGGKNDLVVVLSGTGYHELYLGTYEQAVANGANTANWIHGATNADGKWEFRIPLNDGDSYIPLVAISNRYYNNYLAGKNSIDRAFYPRQLTLDIENKTLTTNDYVKNQELTVVNNVKMFKPLSATLDFVGGPNSNTFVANLLLTMGSDSFDKVYVGRAKDATDTSAFEIDDARTFTLKVKWVSEEGKPETLQTIIGKPVIMSFHSVKENEWYERKVTIDEENGTITFDAVKEEEEPSEGGDTPAPTPTPSGDDSKKDGGADTQGTPAAVDNTTALADGIYTPDSFSFSGGSGRITITCKEVIVRDGKAYATLVFHNNRSGNAQISKVKASGRDDWEIISNGGTKQVAIPVVLNQNNTIVATTEAMSANHDIVYTIFISIAGADAQKGGALSSNDELDKEAPAIPGLTFENEEKLEYAEYFKVFNYSDGIKLLEIDMRMREDEKDDAKKDDTESSTEINETTKKNVALHDEEDENLISGNETAAEETEDDGITTTADAQAELYKGNVIKYLFVPENVEIPAGLEKEVIVINLPVESVYSGSDDISKLFKELKIEDLITSQVEEDKDNKDILAAGDYKELDLKALIKSKCDLVLLPEESIEAEDVKDEKAQKEAKENFEKLAEDLANLDIPVLVDRAEYEETEEAKAEWIKVYGMLFGCEKEANELFKTMTN